MAPLSALPAAASRGPRRTPRATARCSAGGAKWRSERSISSRPFGDSEQPPPAAASRGPVEAGFTLVEILVSLILLLLALGLAGQLLVEGQQSLVDTAAEATDAPAPLAIARLRGDVLSSPTFGADGGSVLLLDFHPAGQVQYRQEGSLLIRQVRDPLGVPRGEDVLMRRVGSFSASRVGDSELLCVTIRYLAFAPRRSPLVTAPGQRGRATVWKTETLFLTPRGRG